MDTIVLAITISAGALVVHYRERLRHFVPLGPKAGRSAVLVDRVLGLSQLVLPQGWRQAHDLNETAGIEAINPLHGRHLIVISDALEDFVPEMTVYEHSVNTRAELTGNIRLIACSGPERRIVDGFECLQYEIEGFFQQTRIKYLHTTVAGRRAFHQVLAWSTISRYDRAAFDQLLNGFTELPSASAALRLENTADAPQIDPHSQYDVH
jgi:hypothetical protein